MNDWLKQYYLYLQLEYGGQGMITTKEFTELTALACPEAYMVGEVMTLALALATRKHKLENEVTIISDVDTMTLFELAIGESSLDSSKDTDMVEHIRRAILDESKRWIILSVSDGMKEIGRQEMQPKDNGDKPKDQENKNDGKEYQANKKGNDHDAMNIDPPQESTGPKSKAENASKKTVDSVGNHWGVLIVDKTQHVAHWVDSAVGLKSVGKKLKIDHMFRTGRFAGKVLCGIDIILSTRDDFEKGKFDANTLKYVPQQGLHNTTRNDAGPCGPFAFAFLDHIYTNRAKMNNLKASFPSSRRDQLRFNSLNQRREIRRLIQQEAESQNPEAPPLGITLDILRILRLPDVDDIVNRVRAFQSKAPAHHPGASVPGDAEAFTEEELEIIEIMKQDMAERPQEYKGLSEKEALEFFLASQDYAAVAMRIEPPLRTLESLLDYPDGVIEIPQDFANTQEVPAGRLKEWQLANIDRFEQLKLGDNAGELTIRAVLQVLSGVEFSRESPRRLENIWLSDYPLFTEAERDEKDEKRKLTPEMIAMRLQNRYEVFKMKKLPLGLLPPIYPEGKTEVPYFPAMDGDDIEPWWELNPLMPETEEDDYSYDWNRVGLLFIHFGGRFEDETAENLLEHWLYHDAIFKGPHRNGKDKITDAEIVRKALIDHHAKLQAKYQVATKFVKRKAPTQNTQQSGGEGTSASNTGAGNPTIQSGGFLQPSGKIGAKPADAKSKTTPKNWPPGTTELPNFARLSSKDVKRWGGANSDVYLDPVAALNDMTAQARLHLKFKHTFRQVDDKDLLQFWVHDRNVFDEMDCNDPDLTATDIMRRLREYYEPEKLKLEAVAARKEEEIKEKAKAMAKFAKTGSKRKATGELAPETDKKRHK
jgi:hypothetical protein